MTTILRKTMCLQRACVIVAPIAALTIRYRCLLLAASVVLATVGCAGQNVRDTSANLRNAQDRGLEYASSNPTRQSIHASRETLRIALRNYYQQWQGVPYVYGGHSQSGIDCSSFVRHTFDAVESYALPRTTIAQARMGTSISRRHLETGDLVFFRTGRSGHHVGVYLGQGRFMHASTNDGVTISRLDDDYWRRHYWQSRRVIAGSG